MKITLYLCGSPNQLTMTTTFTKETIQENIKTNVFMDYQNLRGSLLSSDYG